MKKLVYFLLAGTSLLTIASCNKEEQAPTPSPKTAEQLLTANTWRVTSSYHYSTASDSAAVPNGNPNPNPNFPQCERDNSWKFDSTGTVVMDEGATRCDSSAVATNRAHWKMSGDKKTLSIITPNENRQYDLLKITSDTLRIRTIVVSTNQGRAAHTLTFRPQ